MNKYRLTPVPDNLTDNDWRASDHKDVIEVCAEDESDARILCDAATGIAVERKSISQSVSLPPWKQDRLVSCVLIEENCNNDRGITHPKHLKQG